MVEVHLSPNASYKHGTGMLTPRPGMRGWGRASIAELVLPNKSTNNKDSIRKNTLKTVIIFILIISSIDVTIRQDMRTYFSTAGHLNHHAFSIYISIVH